MTAKIPRKSINAVERLVSEMRAYMSEAERGTSMRVGGYMILRGSVADRLNEAEERIKREVRAVRKSVPAEMMPSFLDELLTKVEAACPLSQKSLEARSTKTSDTDVVKVQVGEMLYWNFWEGRKNVILDIEELLGSTSPRTVVPVRKARAALTSREDFVLKSLESARASSSGKGLTAPQLWRQQDRIGRVSEDRIRRIILALREKGFPIENSGNGGGYILLRPVKEVLRELGLGPEPTA